MIEAVISVGTAAVLASVVAIRHLRHHPLSQRQKIAWTALCLIPVGGPLVFLVLFSPPEE